VKTAVVLKIGATISIPCSGIDQELIDKFIQGNTFSNPVHKSNELHRRSNWNIASTITTYRQEGENLILPRGYMREILNSCHENNIVLQIIDDRSESPCDYPQELKGISLRPYQKRAVESALQFHQGVVIAPTGSGKSLIALEVLRQRQQKALIIVHRADLAKQWAETIKKHLCLKAGIIGSGQWKIGKEITIAMIQTLSSKEKTMGLSNVFGLVLCDECHHLPCQTCFNVMSLLGAKYKYGLSATVERRDLLEQMIYRCVGPAIATITRKEVEELGATVPATVMALETGFSPTADSWHAYLTALAADEDRNLFIIKLATSQISPVLILCDRVVHGETLSEMLSKRKFKHVLAHGQVADREEVMKKIKKAQITIATTSLIGEGIDVSSWGVLIMASPISSEIKLMQAIGRIVRPADGKENAIVYDLRDSCGLSGASFKKRFDIYRKHRLTVDFDE